MVESPRFMSNDELQQQVDALHGKSKRLLLWGRGLFMVSGLTIGWVGAEVMQDEVSVDDMLPAAAGVATLAGALITTRRANQFENEAISLMLESTEVKFVIDDPRQQG